MTERNAGAGRSGAEPLRYHREPGRLAVDLRPEGVSFMPMASRRTGRVRTDAPALHVHPGMVEICYCLRGSLAFETPAREWAFLPGCVFTSREDEPHRLTANPKGLFVYRVLAALPGPGGRFDGLDAADTAWLRGKILALPRRFRVSDGALKTAFEALFAAYEDRAREPARRRVELRRRALDVLLACVDAAARGAVRRVLPPVEDWVRRMERDPAADYSLPDMSRAARLTPAAFARAFKESAGLPPHAFLRRCRIQRAAKMLAEGRSVTATALALGFCTAQHFATAFKAETGRTPRDLRKRAK